MQQIYISKKSVYTFYYRLFHTMLLCIALWGGVPGIANSADTCTGWGGEVTKFVDLRLPTTLDLTTNNNATGIILASGSVSVPPLNCINESGEEYTQTSTNWMNGSSELPDIRTISSGLGLRLKYVTPTGGIGVLPSINSVMNSASTNGLNWTTVKWELIRISGVLTPGSLSLTNIATVTVGANVEGSGKGPTLWLKNSAPVIISANCVLSVNKSLIILPDTTTQTLKMAGVSESVSLAAAINCPQNTFISNGASLTLSTSVVDATDITLVGNTGTSTGVGIEVIDNEGKRVSASGGVVHQALFTQESAAIPGAIQNFSVRARHHSGTEITAGTIRGTFILTLAIN